MIDKQYFKERSKERSTWLGIITFLGGLGWVINPEHADIIAGSIAAIAGVIWSISPDKS